MTTSEENRYIFSFKKVINTEKRRRQSYATSNSDLFGPQSPPGLSSDEKTKTAEKDLIVSAEEQKTLRHSENLASCTNRR